MLSIDKDRHAPIDNDRSALLLIIICLTVVLICGVLAFSALSSNVGDPVEAHFIEVVMRMMQV